VGHLAVCASAHYAVTAAAQGAPIHSFASVAGWFHDTAHVAPFYGDVPGVEAGLRRAYAAIERYQQDGTVVTVPAYEAGNEAAGMFIKMDYYSNPERGAVPEWHNEMAEMSWLPWLTFDGLSVASTAKVPALFVHSEGCVVPDNIRRLQRVLPGPADVVWGQGEILVKYPPEGFSACINGKAAILDSFRPLFAKYETFTSDIAAIYHAADSAAVCAECRNWATLVDGTSYTNDNIAVFVFQDGLIREYHDYFDPRRFQTVVDALARIRDA
jgi:ketosteroid isomerase-like protein